MLAEQSRPSCVPFSEQPLAAYCFAQRGRHAEVQFLAKMDFARPATLVTVVLVSRFFVPLVRVSSFSYLTRICIFHFTSVAEERSQARRRDLDAISSKNTELHLIIATMRWRTRFYALITDNQLPSDAMLTRCSPPHVKVRNSIGARRTRSREEMIILKYTINAAGGELYMHKIFKRTNYHRETRMMGEITD